MMLSLLATLVILTQFQNNSFIEYYAIYHFNTLNQTLYGYIIESNITFFPNGTVSFDFYQINLNFSKYIGPIRVYNNLSSPTSLYIFQGVGDEIVYRGNTVYTLIGKDNGYYVYESTQYLSSTVRVEVYYYVNESGIPHKIVFLQYGLGNLVSNTTFVLYSTNFINPNAKLYFPQGLQRVTQGVPFTPTFEFNVQNVVFSSLVILSAIILSVKLYSAKKGKKVK